MKLTCKILSLLVLTIILSTPASVVSARALLGISYSENPSAATINGTPLASQMEEAFGNLVTVHNYQDKKTLINMLTRFNKLDAALLTRKTYDQHNSAALIVLSEITVTGDSHEETIVLATHSNTSQEEHNQLLQGYQEFLFNAEGLELLEKYATSTSTQKLPAKNISKSKTESIGKRSHTKQSAVIVPPLNTLQSESPAEIDAEALIKLSSNTSSASNDEDSPKSVAPSTLAKKSINTVTPQRAPISKDVNITKASKAPLQAPTPLKLWQAHIDLQGKLGNERALGELELFIPMAQNQKNLLFLDLRFQTDDNNSTEGNFGLGYRRLFNNTLILGGYGFYDLRSSAHGNKFSQTTLGLEALTKKIDTRFNLYLADEKNYLTDEKTPFDQILYSGIYLIHESGGTAFKKYEKSMSGYDAEFGYLLPWFIKQEVRAYVGGYRFSASGLENISGPKGRLEVRFPDIFNMSGSLFELGAELRHDKLRDTDYLISARARVPFGSTNQASKKPSGLFKRMTERIQRDPDIIVSQYRNDTTTPIRREVLTDGGEPVTIAHVGSQATAGDGGVETPFNSLTTAVNSGNDIVLVKANSSFTGEAVNLQEDQKLLGATVAHEIKINTDKFGLINLPIIIENGLMPVVVGDGVGPAITLADGNEVSGIHITDAGTAFLGNDAGGININRNKMTNVQRGIYLDGLTPHSSTNQISNNIIQGVSDDGIVIINRDPGATSVNISGNQLTDLNSALEPAGIVIENYGDDFTAMIAENVVSNTSGEGLLITNQNGGNLSATVYGNKIYNSFSDGIGVVNNNGTLNLYLQNNYAEGNRDDLADYFLQNLPGNTFNLGASSGNPAIGTSVTDTDSNVIAFEGNTGAPPLIPNFIDIIGTFSIVNKETIAVP